MTRTELKTLFSAALRPTPSAQFSAEDVNATALREALSFCGIDIDNVSARELRAHRDTIFGIIEEAIDELLPAALTNVLGVYAEVKTFGRNDEVLFKMSGLGKQRARMAIVAGARSGLYKARRLDNKNLTMSTKTYTVGAYITLEELIAGTVSLAEMFQNIVLGFEEIVYVETVKALRTAKTMAPKANITSGNGFSGAAVDGLIKIVRQYGNPVIMGFQSAIAKINNGAGWEGVTPNVDGADLAEVRAYGYVTKYHGVPVIVLPNYLTDGTNAEFLFNEGDLFILPAGVRPIKVAIKGDTVITEYTQPAGGVEQNVSKMFGVGLVLANNICVYTDKDITAQGI